MTLLLSTWKTIGDEIQIYVVLKKRLQPCEHKGKSFRRADGLLRDFLLSSLKPTVCDTHKGCVVWPRGKYPLHSRRVVKCSPFNEYSLIWLNCFYIDIRG